MSPLNLFLLPTLLNNYQASLLMVRILSLLHLELNRRLKVTLHPGLNLSLKITFIKYIPLRGVFDLGQHVPENADRKRRHYERDDQEEKDEGSYIHYILSDSLRN